MKKGISLIVLVITIIVMIILAAAIIISISNSNIINKANKAVTDTNIATIKEAAALKFADVTLAIKEAGNDSILGGKTLGEYIEQELISDGTMKKSDAVIFTPNGGVYGPNEYNSIPDKSEARDWRYYNGKLFYVGLDMEKRAALAASGKASVQYIYAYIDSNTDYELYTLSDIGFLGKVKSYKELYSDEIRENFGIINSGVNSSNIGSTDIVIATGMRLYAETNYQNFIGEVIVPGDIVGTGNYCDLGDNFGTIYQILQYYGIDPENGLNPEELETYMRDATLENVEEIVYFTIDMDMDNDLDLADFGLIYRIILGNTDIDHAMQFGKKISDMDFYGELPETDSGEQNKTFYRANYNIDKVVYRLPADISK